jgi:hypothetical protein
MRDTDKNGSNEQKTEKALIAFSVSVRPIRFLSVSKLLMLVSRATPNLYRAGIAV